MEVTTINESLPFAALTVGQAKQIICGLVSEELKKVAPKEDRPLPDRINIDDAIIFLKEQGYPITKKAFYNKTFKGTIPFQRIGKRLVFSRKELLQWMDEKSQRKETNSDAALRLAESVKNKK